MKNEYDIDTLPTITPFHEDSIQDTLQIIERPPRREIVWNRSGFTGSSLSYICQSYTNLVHGETIYNSSHLQLPRRIGPRNRYGQACSCEGYRREEVTLRQTHLGMRW